MIAALFAVLLFALVASKLLRIGKREKGLPPGPPTAPVLGNLHMFPTQFAHYKLTEWARQYGEIYSLKMGPGTAIVLSSAAAVKDLMDKKSAITADRPASYIVDTVTGGFHVALTRYSNDWRALRKTAHAMLTPQASLRHIPIQKAEAIQLMHDIVNTPENFYTHVRRYSISVILSVLYGKRCPRYETKEATDFFEAQHLWERVMEPGSQPPIDMLPFLNCIPARWAPWKRACAEVRKRQRDVYFGLLTDCQKRLAKGEENGCYIEQVLTRQDELGLTEEHIGYLGGVLIEGAADTTSSFLQSLILVLVAFPDAQRKAHDEIDRVVGDHRLPSLEDFENLPYIQACIKETHRFRPVSPLAIPHAAIAQEQYRGYLIPQGATIFMDTWGIYHDPQLFDHPEIFDPDRYIQTEYGTKVGVDDSDFRHTFIFGSGRRICPGMHLANHSLIINAMNLIWGFNFDQAVDPATGLNVPVDTFDYHRGLLTGPEPFKCKITPRSQAKVDMIKKEFITANEIFSKFE